MIQHKNMTASARSRAASYTLDLSSTTHSPTVVYEANNDIKIKSIDLVYAVATSSDSQGEKITVGIAGTLTKYCDITIAVSTAAGTVTAQTVASTDLLTKGTPLIITRSAFSGTSNTGEVAVVVHYELIDSKVEV